MNIMLMSDKNVSDQVPPKQSSYPVWHFKGIIQAQTRNMIHNSP